MALTDAQLAFLQAQSGAAMVTVGAADGRPKMARVAYALVDGHIWSSGTADRARTRRLRSVPQASFYVADAEFQYLGVDTDVAILDGDGDGPAAAAVSLRFFRQLQGTPTGPLSWFGRTLDEDAFLQVMVDEGRLIYDCTITRAYGLIAG